MSGLRDLLERELEDHVADHRSASQDVGAKQHAEKVARAQLRVELGPMTEDQIFLKTLEDWLVSVREAEEAKAKEKAAAERVRYIQALRRMSYGDYLRSDHWKSIRAAVLLRDRYKCRQCGSRYRLQVHHLTYENRGTENPDELITYCRRCHEHEHRVHW